MRTTNYHSDEEKDIATTQFAVMIIDPTVEIFKIRAKLDPLYDDLYHSLVSVQLGIKVFDRTINSLSKQNSELRLRLMQQESELVQLRIQNENLKDGL